MEGKILVTGGAGFIGSHIAEHLVGMKKKVIILDDLSGGFRENVPAETEFIEGSILDADLLQKIFEINNITHIFHAAAYAAEGLSHFIKRFNYNNNLIGSVNLINMAINHEVKCFVFTSSIAVYGQGQLPFTEDMTPHPEDSYGIAKYAVEQELYASHKIFGLDYVIFRPHNVYGEKQNIGDKYRNVVGIFMNQIMKKEPMIVFGDGEQTRAFTYIDGVAPAIAQSAFMGECYNQTYNIGGDHVCAVRHLAEVVAQNMGVTPDIRYIEERNEVKHAYSDHEKTKKCFGQYISDVTLEQGISKMAAWAKSKGPMESGKFDNIEVLKNLPPSWLENIV